MIKNVKKHRINGEVRWPPALPGRNGDRKQYEFIKPKFGACKAGGTRRLQPPGPGGNWEKAQTLSKGRGDQASRPCLSTLAEERVPPPPIEERTPPLTTRGSCDQAAAAPPRTPPMAADSDLQAAVSARLHNMLENSE